MGKIEQSESPFFYFFYYADSSILHVSTTANIRFDIVTGKRLLRIYSTAIIRQKYHL